MDLNEYKKPEVLEKYAFFWSEARLLIAALALFIGGTPPVYYLTFPLISGLVGMLLTASWIISGLVSGYLSYRWWTGGQMVFGGKAPRDTAAFFVNIVSGLNLGFTGLSGTNIGMSISSNYILFIIVGVLYLASAYHLYARWTALSL